jgi:hypothetical protein
VTTGLLGLLADQALAAVQVAYTADVDAEPLPDRQLVSAGQAPWDCELLNVWVVRDYPTSGGPEGALMQSISSHAGHYFRAAVLGIQLVRCYPLGPDQGGPPPLATEVAAAETIHADVDRLWQALLYAADRGEFSQRNGVVYEGWQAVGPEGGLAGGVMTLHALLPPPA